VAGRQADIVVGLATYNDARTVGAVTKAIQAALSRSFGASDVRLVVADAGSADGTREAVRAAAGSAALVEVECPTAAFTALPYHRHPGRADAVRAVLQTARQLGAAACVLVDTQVESSMPEWLERLIAPVLTDSVDYVTPYYGRRVNEGAITRSIVYPMFRALYGVRLRQPATGEFGCSARLIAHFLEQDFWDVEHAQVGIDLWLAAEAACGEFRISEASLGVRRAAPVEPGLDLSTTLAQIVGALFADLEHRVDVWQRIRRSVPVPLVGSVLEPGESPPVDLQGLIESFRLGYRELREIWTWILPPRTIIELRRLTEMPADRFRFEDRLWASIIYAFALGYSLRVMPHDHLLRSLTPLYSGWLASFINQMPSATLVEIEERVEQVCLGFEAEKRQLIAGWRWPERLR